MWPHAFFNSTFRFSDRDICCLLWQYKPICSVLTQVSPRGLFPLLSFSFLQCGIIGLPPPAWELWIRPKENWNFHQCPKSPLLSLKSTSCTGKLQRHMGSPLNFICYPSHYRAPATCSWSGQGRTWLSACWVGPLNLFYSKQFCNYCGHHGPSWYLSFVLTSL